MLSSFDMVVHFICPVTIISVQTIPVMSQTTAPPGETLWSQDDRKFVLFSLSK